MNKTQRVFAHVFKGQRFDVGNKEGYLETSIQYGLRHLETRDALKQYIIDLEKKFQKLCRQMFNILLYNKKGKLLI